MLCFGEFLEHGLICYFDVLMFAAMILGTYLFCGQYLLIDMMQIGNICWNVLRDIKCLKRDRDRFVGVHEELRHCVTFVRFVNLNYSYAMLLVLKRMT